MRYTVVFGIMLLIFANTVTVFAEKSSKKEMAEYIYSAEDYERIGDYEKAFLYYAKAINSEKNDTFALEKRAMLYFRLGKLNDAIKDYTEAINRNSSSENYVNRGTVHYRSGNFKEALDDYNNAIKKDSKFINAYFNRGVLYHKTKNYDAAIVDFTTLINIKNDVSRYYIIRAGIYYEAGDYQASLKDCNNAIELDGDVAHYYKNRAEVLKRLKRIKDAEADETKADFLLRKEVDESA